MRSPGSLRYSIKLRVSFKLQFRRFSGVISMALRGAILVSALIFAGAQARAQQAPPVVANIEGDDVAIAASASAIPVPQNPSSGGAILNGGVVTVGSGQARLMLTSGGEIDICGPAKITLLQSSGAITVALDFGHIRAYLPASSSLRIFTPTLIATPLEINGVASDVSVGLQQDDSLCVKAASGALLLESQFTNEKIVVPQSGQFFFAQGRLVPVVRTDMHCACLLTEARFLPPPSATPAPALGDLTPAEIASEATPASPAKTLSEKQDQTGVEYSILAHPNDAHPTALQHQSAPAPPPDETPFYRIVMPPLAFSASSPAPPPVSAEDMVLLIRTTRIDPDFEFTGRVDPPSAPEKAKSRTEKAPRGRQPKIAGAKPGFWARLKRFFAGSSS